MRNPVSKKSRGKSALPSVIVFLALSAFIWVSSLNLRSRIIPPEPTTTSSPVLSEIPVEITPTDTATAKPLEPTTCMLPELIPTQPAPQITAPAGLLVFAMSDGLYTHLFAYHPENLPLTRITDNPWDDQQPAVSPEGTKIAFSSRRNGYWDIYVLDLTSGDLIRVTDTPQFDGSPTWSPDSQWLAFESYLDDNLEIMLQSLADLSQPAIRLTNDPAADYSPVWSPEGREIAFVSTTSGDEEIWLAYLDRVEGRFFNLSHASATSELYPAWSSDGRFLAWTSQTEGLDQIYVRDFLSAYDTPRLVGSGQMPAWSPDNNVLAAVVKTPTQTALVAYRLADGQMNMPPFSLPGSVEGMDWQNSNLPALLAKNLPSTNDPIPPQLWQKVISEPSDSELGRYNLVILNDVNAPYTFMQDSIDESFSALRQELARQSGWDILGDLENVFIPITEPPHPGQVDDWLFTGRAFALQSSSLQAGWMIISRENEIGATYWRVWIRTRYQDGSQGQPMRVRPWNLDARFSGDPKSYEQGGDIQPVPAGYWLDLTELAARFGWEPLPALSNWHNYYPAARFNQFVFSEGMDWETAMQQIYPPEAVQQPTAIPSLTLQPLLTSIPWVIITTPTPASSPNGSGTLRPTWTPLPGD